MLQMPLCLEHAVNVQMYHSNLSFSFRFVQLKGSIILLLCYIFASNVQHKKKNTFKVYGVCQHRLNIIVKSHQSYSSVK